VYADAVPLGKATFTIGEKKKEAGALSQYHVIDKEELVSEPLEPPQDVLKNAEPLSGKEISNATEPVAPAVPQGQENNASQSTASPESLRE
jgi:hypothetical protein